MMTGSFVFTLAFLFAPQSVKSGRTGRIAKDSGVSFLTVAFSRSMMAPIMEKTFKLRNQCRCHS